MSRIRQLGHGQRLYVLKLWGVPSTARRYTHTHCSTVTHPCTPPTVCEIVLLMTTDNDNSALSKEITRILETSCFLRSSVHAGSGVTYSLHLLSKIKLSLSFRPSRKFQFQCSGSRVSMCLSLCASLPHKTI